MKFFKNLILGILLALSMACISVNPIQQSDMDPSVKAILVERLMELAVTVGTPTGAGTGVWISSTEVLTAKHVVQAQQGFFRDVWVEGTDGLRRPMRVVEVSNEKLPGLFPEDWAILELKVKDQKVRAWAQTDCRDPRVGESLISVGNGLGSGLLPYFGNVQAEHMDISVQAERPELWDDVFVSSTNGAPGVSGGPVFDRNGYLVGQMVGVFSVEGYGIIQQFNTYISNVPRVCF